MIQKIFSKKNVALAVLILAAGILYMTSGSSDGEEWQVIAVTETDARSEEETEEAGLPSETGGKDMPTAEEADSEPTGGMQMVFVHVAGAVNSPGVYQVEAGTRVYQVIDLAGGLTGDADREFLNMAQLVADGQKITVYTKEEVEAGEAERHADGAVSGTVPSAKEKINLNTAGKEALMSLTGIGEAKADAILAYRMEHGTFQSIEEIMEVPGIKSAAFEKIKDDITV